MFTATAEPTQTEERMPEPIPTDGSLIDRIQSRIEICRDWENKEASAGYRLEALKLQAARRKAELAGDVTGSNETIRKAMLEQALEDDANYQATQLAIVECQVKFDTAHTWLSYQKRCLSVEMTLLQAGANGIDRLTLEKAGY